MSLANTSMTNLSLYVARIICSAAKFYLTEAIKNKASYPEPAHHPRSLLIVSIPVEQCATIATCVITVNSAQHRQTYKSPVRVRYFSVSMNKIICSCLILYLQGFFTKSSWIPPRAPFKEAIQTPTSISIAAKSRFLMNAMSSWFKVHFSKKGTSTGSFAACLLLQVRRWETYHQQ